MTQTSTSNATYTQLACLGADTGRNEPLLLASPGDSQLTRV